MALTFPLPNSPNFLAVFAFGSGGGVGATASAWVVSGTVGDGFALGAVSIANGEDARAAVAGEGSSARS